MVRARCHVSKDLSPIPSLRQERWHTARIKLSVDGPRRRHVDRDKAAPSRDELMKHAKVSDFLRHGTHSGPFVERLHQPRDLSARPEFRNAVMLTTAR